MAAIQDDDLLNDDNNEEEIQGKQKDNGEDDAEEKPKRDFSKIINIIEKVIFVLIVIGIIITVPLYLIDFKTKKDVINQNSLISQDVYIFPKPKKQEPYGIFRFPSERQNEEKEFQVVLSDLQTLIKFSFYIAVADNTSDVIEEITKRQKEILDKVLYIISTKTYEDVNTIDKREFNLKKEIINEINSILNQGKAKDIYFSLFMVTKQKKI